MVLDEPDSKHGSEVADRLVMTTAERCSDLIRRLLGFAPRAVFSGDKEKIMAKRKEKPERRPMVQQRPGLRLLAWPLPGKTNQRWQSAVL